MPFGATQSGLNMPTPGGRFMPTRDTSNDVQAIEAWLQRYRERPGTLRSYRKEVERFLLWCLLELRKPVSSVTSADCQAYRAFMQDVPAPWVNVMPVARTDPMWRPFRGQPSPATQKQALVIVQCMFEGLMDAGYLNANAMRSVMKSFNLPAPKLQVQRSFSEAETRYVRAMIDAEPSGPLQRRLRALVELLLATGIRLDELAKSTHGDLREVEVDGETELAWMLTVLGKRRKLREVPVPNSVIELLRAHAADVDVPEAQARPLIAALGPGPGGNGGMGASMTASGLYAFLKRFLGRCAKAASKGLGVDAEHLAAASTHWLRHSFGRRAAVAGVPLEVISQAMGHASLTTTSVYLTQERSRMVRELRRIA
jgi:site-specific recombinase XerD